MRSLRVCGPFYKLPFGEDGRLTWYTVLPGLGKPKELPKKDDIQGIVQYKMFGDPKHTGNGTILTFVAITSFEANNPPREMSRERG